MWLILTEIEITINFSGHLGQVCGVITNLFAGECI